MAEVTLTINGRNYGVACDDGQEDRLRDLGYYIDQRMREIAQAGAAGNESHLMILASLMLACARSFEAMGRHFQPSDGAVELRQGLLNR